MGVKGWEKVTGKGDGRIREQFRGKDGCRRQNRGRRVLGGGSEQRAAVGWTDTQMDTRTRTEPEQRVMGDERDRGMGGMDGGGEGHEWDRDGGRGGDGGNERGGETML